MAVATVTSKGQVTIPKEVRDELGIETGTKLYFVRTAQGYVLKPARNSILALAGTVQYDGPALSIEEMDDAVRLGVAAENERILEQGRQ
jgi:antitoxin PrlF